MPYLGSWATPTLVADEAKDAQGTHKTRGVGTPKSNKKLSKMLLSEGTLRASGGRAVPNGAPSSICGCDRIPELPISHRMSRRTSVSWELVRGQNINAVATRQGGWGGRHPLRVYIKKSEKQMGGG